MDKISIIIPVYKVEKYLDRCLESVVNQTYQNLEIILVDDGSPDNCPAICDEWAKKDKRIKVIHKRNEGVSVARNTGLKAATGEYIGFVDSDDFIFPEMYEKLYKSIKKTGADLAQCRFQRIFSNGEIIPSIIKKFKLEEIFTEKKDFFKYLFGGGISFYVVNKLFSIKILNNVFFPKGIGCNEDMVFTYRSLKNAQKIVLINDIFYNYDVSREDSATKIGFNLKDIIKAINLVIDDLDNNYSDLIKYIDIFLVKKITLFFQNSRKALKEKPQDISVCKHMMLWSKLTFKHRLKYLFFQSKCSKIQLLRHFCLVFFPGLTDFARPFVRALFSIGRRK